MWSRRHLRQREKEKFAPDMECCVLHGATSAKLSEKAQEELPFLSITTYGMAARLDRGKRYVRTGTVVDLQIKTGKIEARVQGRRKTPYKVEIRISPLNQAHCQGISRSV